MSSNIRNITLTATRSEYGLGIVFNIDNISSIILKASLTTHLVNGLTLTRTNYAERNISVLYLYMPTVNILFMEFFSITVLQ